MPINHNAPALIDQPTGSPTRKLAFAGVAGIVIAPLIAGLAVELFPNLSEACGEELGVALTAAGSAAFSGLLAFLTGYRTRNRATDLGH